MNIGSKWNGGQNFFHSFCGLYSGEYGWQHGSMSTSSLRHSGDACSSLVSHGSIFFLLASTSAPTKMWLKKRSRERCERMWFSTVCLAWWIEILRPSGSVSRRLCRCRLALSHRSAAQGVGPTAPKHANMQTQSIQTCIRTHACKPKQGIEGWMKGSGGGWRDG